MCPAPLRRVPVAVRLSQPELPSRLSRSGLRGAAGAAGAPHPSPGITPPLAAASPAVPGDEGWAADSPSVVTDPDSPLLPELLLDISFSHDDFLGSFLFPPPSSLKKRSGGSESSLCGPGCCPTTLADAIIPSFPCNACVFGRSECVLVRVFTPCPECKLNSRPRQACSSDAGTWRL